MLGRQCVERGPGGILMNIEAGLRGNNVLQVSNRGENSVAILLFRWHDALLIETGPFGSKVATFMFSKKSLNLSGYEPEVRRVREFLIVSWSGENWGVRRVNGFAV